MIGFYSIEARTHLIHRVSTVLIFVLLTGSAGATDYYVATNGSNSHPGTLSQPFLTIQQAANAAHAGDNVYVLEGTYRETVNVLNSGTVSAPITFQPYQGANVTISGLDVFDGSWSPYSGSTYTATVTDGASQVFVNGKVMTEARWPNPGYDNPLRATRATVGSASINPYPATSTLTSIDLTGAANLTGAKIAVTAGGEYVAISAPVTGHSGTTLNFQWPAGYSSSSYHPRTGNPFYAYGSLSTLDSPKEWYYDSSASKLYLEAPGGVNPGGQTVEVRKRELGFDIDRWAAYVQVSGFRLQAAGVNVAGNYNLVDNVQALYPTSFTEPAGWNNPDDPAGVRISGHHNTLQNSEIAYSWGDGVRLTFSSNTVTNNVIHDVDWNGTDAAFINADDSGGRNTITNNTMYNAGRSGVTYRYTNVDSNIEHNHISRYGYLTADLGGIYTFVGENTGTVVAYNHVHDNLSTGTNAGIYLDVDSHGNTVHHNLVTNASWGVLFYGNTTAPQGIYNNTLWDVGAAMLAGGGGYTNTTTRNNLANTGPWLGATVSNNWTGSDPFVDSAADDYTLRSGTGPVDYGTVIPGITDGYNGSAPDAGAFELGDPAWTTGADFKTWLFSNQEVAPLTNALYVTQSGEKVTTGPLKVGYTFSGNRAFLKFDLSGISQDKYIESATLRIYENALPNSANGGVKLLEVLSDWTTASLTYDQSVDLGAPISGFYDPANLDFYTNIDVTSLVLGWLDDPATDFGFSLRGTETLIQTVKYFEGFYGVTSPELVITYGALVIPGDADLDGVVDDADAAALANNWQTGPGATWAMGDFNEDGFVNDLDATILATNWGAVAQAAVPEPSVLAGLVVLMLAGLLASVRRRY